MLEGDGEGYRCIWMSARLKRTCFVKTNDDICEDTLNTNLIIIVTAILNAYLYKFSFFYLHRE